MTASRGDGGAAGRQPRPVAIGAWPGRGEGSMVADATPAAPGSPPGPDMVWIPGGTFVMGSDQHYPEEAPAHPVTVGGFWIDRHTVTNAPQGKRHGCRRSRGTGG